MGGEECANWLKGEFAMRQDSINFQGLTDTEVKRTNLAACLRFPVDRSQTRCDAAAQTP
jgi:hypothetical protein